MAVADTTGNQSDGNASGLSPKEDAQWELAHQRLSVGCTLAGNDEVCVVQQLIKMQSVKQEVDARAAVGIQVLHEGIAQTSGGTRTGTLLAVVAEVEG